MDDEAQRLVDEAFEHGVESVFVTTSMGSPREFHVRLSRHRHADDGEGVSAMQTISVQGAGPTWIAALRDAVGKLRSRAEVAAPRRAELPDGPRMAVRGQPGLMIRRRVP